MDNHLTRCLRASATTRRYVLETSLTTLLFINHNYKCKPGLCIELIVVNDHVDQNKVDLISIATQTGMIILGHY